MVGAEIEVGSDTCCAGLTDGMLQRVIGHAWVLGAVMDGGTVVEVEGVEIGKTPEGFEALAVEVVGWVVEGGKVYACWEQDFCLYFAETFSLSNLSGCVLASVTCRDASVQAGVLRGVVVPVRKMSFLAGVVGVGEGRLVCIADVTPADDPVALVMSAEAVERLREFERRGAIPGADGEMLY